MSGRITEAKLREIEGLCCDDENAAAREAIALIAEVRRLRGLIVTAHTDPDPRAGPLARGPAERLAVAIAECRAATFALIAEAEAIRAEESEPRS